MTEQESQRNISEAKAALRTALVAARAAIADRPQKERAILHALLRITEEYETVFCYVSMGSETDTIRYIESVFQRKTVLVPYTDKLMTAMRLTSRRVCPDRYGNTAAVEPYTGRIDAAIVPLLGFNRALYRIGYGKGCYDRWFCGHDPVKIGIAFDEQETEFTPEPHDVPLDIIITPERVIRRTE